MSSLCHAQEINTNANEQNTQQLTAEQQLELEFKDSLQEILGISPGQAQQAVQANIELEKASRLPAPNKLRTGFQVVSLAPGAPIPQIRVRPNYPTTFIIEDRTGAPWPINSALPGNADFLSVVTHEGGSQNIVTIVANVYSANAGVLLMLAPNMPLNLQLIVDSKETPDPQITLRLDKSGPNAIVREERRRAPVTTDPLMLQFLYGIPPEGAVELQFSNHDFEGWQYKDFYYTRSAYGLLWPSFIDLVKSGEAEEGMSVYKTSPVASLLFAQDNGTPLPVSVSEKEDH